jgi:hypothetical protein
MRKYPRQKNNLQDPPPAIPVASLLLAQSCRPVFGSRSPLLAVKRTCGDLLVLLREVTQGV